MTAARLDRQDIYRIFLLLGILTCFIIGFWPAFSKISIRWDSDDSNYCYLVIPLFLYLLYDRHVQFRFGKLSWDILGLIPICFSIGLIMVGEFGSVETLMYIGILGCVVGITFLLYGRRIRHLFFPLLILAFIVPLPPFANRVMTFQLKLAASSMATLMLRLSGASVFQDGNIIDLGITQLQVVDACSGLRYLIPLLLLGLLVGYFFSKGLWRRVVLLFFVIPVSVLLNSFRIWVTGFLTIKGHGELAENLFHDFTGWLVFMIAGAILFGITRILNRINHRHTQTHADNLSEETNSVLIEQSESGEGRSVRPSSERSGRPSSIDSPPPTSNLEQSAPPTAAGLTRPVVLTAIVCLMFITSGYALKKIPSARNLPEREEFKSFPMQIGKWHGKRSYISKEILDQLWADDYVQATYFNRNSGNAIHVLIPFYEYQGTRHTAHAPQSCLLGGGWALTESKDRTISLDDGQQIKLMTMNLQKGNSKILGSYFFFMRGRVITSPWMNKFYLMWDSFTKQRTDGALVRAEMVVAPGQSMDEAWMELAGFVAEMWGILPAYVPR